MTKPRLSEEEFKDTLKHFMLAFCSPTDEKDLTPKEIDRACTNIRDVFGNGSKIEPVRKILSREEYEKNMSRVSKVTSVDHVFFCDLCVFVLKERLKKMNSFTLPVIKGRLIKNEPDLMDLNKMAASVYNVISYQKAQLKRIIATEETKLEHLKTLKGKEKKNLKSLFFKRRKTLKASLQKKGVKNAECVLRAYELFSLKMPSKSGKLLRSQEAVADALVEEGLTDKCSQQTVSRWNNVVKRELKR